MRWVRLGLLGIVSLSILVALPCLFAQDGVSSFEPLQHWKAAILGGDSAALKGLYSVDPAPSLRAPGGTTDDVGKEVEFWTSLKSSGLKSIDFEKLQTKALNPSAEQVTFQAVITERGKTGLQKRYVSAGLVWMRQGDAWRIVSSARTNIGRLPQPLAKDSDIYAPGVDARAEIKEAVERAARERKHVILVFGGNWCYDCHVLDAAFHSPEIAPLVQKNYEVVHVDIGEYNRNLDLADEYQVPLKKGVPALAVLGGDGKLLFTQKNGEFESARSLGPDDLTQFLNKWKPAAAAK